MTDTPEHREIPLTLAFKPDDGKGDDPEYRAAGYEGICIAQPSMEEEGRIFVGVNPYGKPVGVHMLPEDAQRLRDHLSKLLLEPDALPVDEGAGATGEEWTPEELLAYRARQEVPARAQRPRDRVTGVTHTRKLPRPSLRKLLPQFRIEFKLGRFEALIVRLDNER
jgi:hypothetical protein